MLGRGWGWGWWGRTSFVGLFLFLLLFLSFLHLLLLLLLYFFLFPLLFAFLVLFLLFLLSFRQIFLFDLLNDLFHLNGIIHHGISLFLLFSHYLKHGILMKQSKILAFIVCDFLLKDVFELLSCMRIGFFCPSQILFVCFLLNFISPIIHPLHSVKMRFGYKTCLDLNSL